MDKELKRALYKKSIGYNLEEVVEEYNQEGEIIKRKVSTKYVPPDTSALKLYLEEGDNQKDIRKMSSEELKLEKIRLLKLLRECEENEDSEGKV